MVRKNGTETFRRIWRLSLVSHFFPLAIIVLLFLMLLSCARGGGTPVSGDPEAGMFDSAVIAPGVDTGTTEEVPFCGNGKLEADNGESCDWTDLGNATCALLWGDQAAGELRCNADCTFNEEMCYWLPTAGGGEDPGTGGSYGGT